MTTDELRAAAGRIDRKPNSWREVQQLHRDKRTLADFAVAILARLSDAEVGEILGREVRGE